MRHYIATLLLFSLSLNASDKMKEYSKEAEIFGKSQKENVIKGMNSFDVQSITPKEQESFDIKEAKAKMDEADLDNEVLTFLRDDDVQYNLQKNSVDQNEFLFERSEALASGELEDSYIDQTEEYVIEKCIESTSPYPVVYTRHLQIDVDYEPAKIEQVRVCNGHKKKKKFFWESDAKEWCKSRKRELDQDPEVQSLKTHISGGGVTSDYKARIAWSHVDGARGCTDYRMEERKGDEKWEIKSERWVYENDEVKTLLDNPDCTMIERTCLDAAPRRIHGRQVVRQCWKEKVTFLQLMSKTKQCAHLRDRNCIEEKRQCVKEGPNGCAVWEFTYKCFSKVRKRSQETNDNIFSLTLDQEYQPNQSLPSVATKLKIFQEMKAEMQSQEAIDASKIELFTGKKMKCSKSVADDLMYDCCFNFGGLAKDMKLSQCTEEENALKAMREKELCVYVGKYEKEFLDLWKSQDVHVYCCFPTKLARIFQEEAKEQLGLGWGKPKKPDCRGLRAEEIALLDFNELDLSGAFDINNQEIGNRLENKMKDYQIDADKIERRINEKLKESERGS